MAAPPKGKQQQQCYTSTPLLRPFKMNNYLLTPLLMQFLCWAMLIAISVASSHEYRNVYGQELQSCSKDGMALTGYTRNGRCVAHDGDRGSHHICINLSSTTGGNFCEVTGQPNWCASENMPCHEDASSRACPIHHWCVCQWAFSRYVERAGGCDQIQEIVCESTSMEALTNYQKHASRYSTALECLVQRCNLKTNTETAAKDDPEKYPNSKQHTEL